MTELEEETKKALTECVHCRLIVTTEPAVTMRITLHGKHYWRLSIQLSLSLRQFVLLLTKL